MAVYSYKTGSTPIKINVYANEEISVFADLVLSDFVSQKNLFRFSSPSNYSFEKYSLAYNESSSLYTLSEDRGLLSDGEAIISDYKDVLIDQFANIAIGDLLSPGSTIEDYGLITDIATVFETAGFITNDNVSANGRVGKLVSTSSDSVTRAAEIQGTVFLFQGKSGVYINSSYIGYANIQYSNKADERNAESYLGSGKAFGFGSKAERVVVSYNNSSVVSYESENYGLIVDGVATIDDYANSTISDYAAIEIQNLLSPGSVTEDYGSILDAANLTSERDDYGLISGLGLIPFGSINLVGESVIGFRLRHIGSGSLFTFIGAEVSKAPRYFGSGVIKVSGSAVEKNTESYVGSGRAFGFGSKAERTVVSYNQSSVVDIESENYGLIVDGVATIGDYADSLLVDYVTLPIQDLLSPGSVTEDYGSILDIANLTSERDNYGSITGVDLRPFGTLKLVGEPVIGFRLRHIGSGSLFAFSSTTEALSANTPENTQIFKITGSVVESNTESYVGSGRAFGFGSKAERTVVSYNQSSVVDYTSLDYGSITGGVATIGDYANALISDYATLSIQDLLSPGSTIEDYGSILDIANLISERDDYGLITGRGLRPFGLTRFSSATVEKNTESYVGTGLIEVNGIGLESITPTTEISYVSISIRGEYSNLRNTESYVGSGRAFGFGSKAERTVVSYNQSSVVDYEGLDYGLITGGVATISDYANDPIGLYSALEIQDLLSPGSVTEDYGSILDVPNLSSERDDYGLITGRGLRPFGLTRFSSATVEKNTESYVGTGSLFAFSSTVAAFGPKPETFGLFRFSGSVVESNTESYVGSGRAFGFGSKAERTAVSYNQSSVVDYEGLDYGSITGGIAFISDYADSLLVDYATLPIQDLLSPGSSIEDYGSILDVPNLSSERDDYGLITGRGLRPFGLTRFSGSLVEKNTESYVGTGSLFAFSSTAEAFGPKPETFGLFRFSGSAAESTTPTTEIGSGSLFTFGSLTETTSKSESGSSLFTFSGSLVEKNTESYVGTGSLFAFSSTSESFGPKPETFGLFRISGSAAESNTPTTEIGSGSLSVRQQSLILDAENKGRLVSAYERVSFEEKIYPEAIKISGEVGIYFQYFETGSGFVNVEGRATIRLNPIHIGGGSFEINGSAAESITPTTEIGSGSIFTFISSSESKVSNPPENTQLFKLTGYSVEKNTESYVGIGLEKINVESLIIIKLRYPGSGNIRISDKVAERRNYTHKGTGRLFGFGSASEYLTNAYKLDTFVVRIRGNAEESATNKFVGSGSIFTFISSSESKGSNPPENTQLFKFYGSGSARTQPIYVGDGFINISKGRGVPDKNNKTYIISSSESKSAREVEKPERIKISGSSGVSVPKVYSGSGSIFTFISKTESTSFSPDDTKVLFKVSGSSIEKNTESYRGSGTIFSITGSSYSVSKKKKEETTLFNISGYSAEAFTPGPHLGSGLIYSNIDSKSSVSFIPKITTTLFEFSGKSQEKTSANYSGYGTLSALSSASKSVFYSYETRQRAFRIFGTTTESFTRSNYIGSIYSILDCYSENRKIDYVPPKRIQIFIV